MIFEPTQFKVIVELLQQLIYIGYGDIYTDNYFNGQLYYISIFASPLSDADLAIVESQ